MCIIDHPHPTTRVTRTSWIWYILNKQTTKINKTNISYIDCSMQYKSISYHYCLGVAFEHLWTPQFMAWLSLAFFWLLLEPWWQGRTNLLAGAAASWCSTLKPIGAEARIFKHTFWTATGHVMAASSSFSIAQYVLVDQLRFEENQHEYCSYSTVASWCIKQTKNTCIHVTRRNTLPSSVFEIITHQTATTKTGASFSGPPSPSWFLLSWLQFLKFGGPRHKLL